MSKTIAIRVSDEVHSALTAKHLATSQSMTELVLPAILGLIELPPAPTSAIEDRVLALETQMLSVADRLMAIEYDKTAIEVGSSEKPAIAMVDRQPVEIMVEPEPIEDILSPVSSRDLGKASTSASEFDRYAVPKLKPYSSGGYYFRLDDIGEPGLKGTIQTQAKLMGFSSQAVKIGGKPTRIWLNRSYCLQAQTSNS